MIHARQDYNDRVQDIDILGLNALFEEMLEDLKTDYLTPYTDQATGNVHPAGTDRWKRYERGYRDSFAKVMTPKIPMDEPVFLLRGQDAVAGAAVDTWVQLSRVLKVGRTCLYLAGVQAQRMSLWLPKKSADVPSGILLPKIEIVSAENPKKASRGRIGSGPIENLCDLCGRLDSEHLGGVCPPEEMRP
jgi:hypothetical protein